MEMHFNQSFSGNEHYLKVWQYWLFSKATLKPQLNFDEGLQCFLLAESNLIQNFLPHRHNQHNLIHQIHNSIHSHNLILKHHYQSYLYFKFCPSYKSTLYNLVRQSYSLLLFHNLNQTIINHCCIAGLVWIAKVTPSCIIVKTTVDGHAFVITDIIRQFITITVAFVRRWAETTIPIIKVTYVGVSSFITLSVA